MRHGLKRQNGVCSGIFILGTSSYWSECHRDIVYGANYNAFATKFTGFSICHPVHDDTKMLKCVQHSLRSAMCSELPTATFLFLPNWENKSINAYRALVRDNPKYCTTLGFIPEAKLKYAMPTSWKGVQRNFSNHTWSKDIIAVWNKEAKQRLMMARQIGCKHCKGASQKQFGKNISTSQERTQTTSPTMFAPSTSNQKERTSLARKEAKTLTSTSNHGTISSSSAPIGNYGPTLTEAA
jgi:hypothetical protein